jgi:hypothetical protein
LNLAADLVGLILQKLDQPGVQRFVRSSAVPIVAVAVGVFFARLFWS